MDTLHPDVRSLVLQFQQSLGAMKPGSPAQHRSPRKNVTSPHPLPPWSQSARYFIWSGFFFPPQLAHNSTAPPLHMQLQPRLVTQANRHTQHGVDACPTLQNMYRWAQRGSGLGSTESLVEWIGWRACVTKDVLGAASLLDVAELVATLWPALLEPARLSSSELAMVSRAELPPPVLI